MGPERKLLLLLVHARDFVDRATERLGPGDFLDPACRAVFQALVADPELTHPPAGMDPVAAQRLEDLLGSPEQLSDLTRVFEDSAAQMRENALESRAGELRAAMRREADPARQEAMVRELEEIARQRRELRVDWRQAVRLRHPPNDPHQPSRGL
jgi:hypothetical protein